MRHSRADGTGFGLFLFVTVILVGLIKAAFEWLAEHPLIAASIPVALACLVGAILFEKRESRIRAEQRRRTVLDSATTIILEHAEELCIRRKQLTHSLNYGLIDDSRWQDEVQFFIERKIEIDVRGFRELPDFQQFVQRTIDEATTRYRSSRLPFSPSMDPVLYEHLVADSLSDHGWITRVTKGSGDQGIDVIAEREQIRVVIQCKRYSKAIGNGAVQEVIAGMAFEGATHAAIVSNATFTRSARQLADTAGVLLLHHDNLATLWARLTPDVPDHPETIIAA